MPILVLIWIRVCEFEERRRNSAVGDGIVYLIFRWGKGVVFSVLVIVIVIVLMNGFSSSFRFDF